MLNTSHHNSLKNSLVFLPGWGFRADIFDALSAYFNTDKITYLDYTEKNEQHSSITSLCKTLAEKISNHSVIVGWSLGGLIALAFNYFFPQKCQKIILVSSSPCFVAQSSWPGITKDLMNDFDQGANTHLGKTLRAFATIVASPQLAYIKQLKSKLLNPTMHHACLVNQLKWLTETDFRDKYLSSQTPLLHILGSHDRLIPISLFDSPIINRCQLEMKVINNAGHAPFITHPNEFITILKTFISQP